MTGSIADRLTCIIAVMFRRREVRHVRLSDGVLSVLKWYGVHRSLIARRLAVTSINDQMEWIDVGEYGIAWPTSHPRSRFVGALIELRAPSNAHYYFDGLTDVREGSNVVDVGASEGSFAVECLVRRKAARVWCFEPDSSMNLALRATAERNHLGERLQIVSAAAARTSGTLQMLENSDDPLASYCFEEPAGTAQERLPGVLKEVEGIALDDWATRTAIGRIDYLKIDAEGSDLAVLQGATKCLQRWRPAIAVTTYHQPDHCNEMIEYLTSLGLGYRFRVKGVIAFHGVARPVMLHAACHRSGSGGDA